MLSRLYVLFRHLVLVSTVYMPLSVSILFIQEFTCSSSVSPPRAELQEGRGLLVLFSPRFLQMAGAE